MPQQTTVGISFRTREQLRELPVPKGDWDRVILSLIESYREFDLIKRYATPEEIRMMQRIIERASKREEEKRLLQQQDKKPGALAAAPIAPVR